jgi:hypothetical protein
MEYQGLKMPPALHFYGKKAANRRAIGVLPI